MLSVVFSYSAMHGDELDLELGDSLEFLGTVEEGWWRTVILEFVARSRNLKP